MFPQYNMSQMHNNQNNQIINSGYAIVRSEEEARSYPLSPGFTMTFFDETQPRLYKKMMSYSPLDQPVFEAYEIIKKEPSANVKPKEESEPAWKADIISLQDEIDRLYGEIQSLKTRPKPMPKKKEDVKDDPE